jgi:uncharacterized protein
MMYQEQQSPTVPFLDILTRVYLWMTFALVVTGLVALSVAYYTPFSNIMDTYGTSILIGSLIAQLAIVLVLSFFINKINYIVALSLFVIYSVLMGITMSLIFKIYTTGSIVTTFFVTGGMFGGMAIYGMITKTDLSQLRYILTMALLGLILAILVNLFLKSSMFDTLISLAGVVIFSGLTAADVQRIKSMSSEMVGQGENISKVALMGALILYLDFINLFLSLLRLMGRRRD